MINVDGASSDGPVRRQTLWTAGTGCTYDNAGPLGGSMARLQSVLPTLALRLQQLGLRFGPAKGKILKKTLSRQQAHVSSSRVLLAQFGPITRLPLQGGIAASSHSLLAQDTPGNQSTLLFYCLGLAGPACPSAALEGSERTPWRASAPWPEAGRVREAAERPAAAPGVRGVSGAGACRASGS